MYDFGIPEIAEVHPQEFSLQLQIDAVRDLMHSEPGMTELLLPYHKKLLEIASRGDVEPSQRPPVEEL